MTNICFVAAAFGMGSAAPKDPNAVSTVYLCDPSNRRTNLEGVTIRNDNSIGIYTTSKTWGAVDEHIFAAEVSVNQDTYIYSSTVATVTVNKKRSGEIHLGDQVMGTFHDQKSDRLMDLTCEYMVEPK